MVRPSAAGAGAMDAAAEGNPLALVAVAAAASGGGGAERGGAPKEPAGLPCPRCASTDTKFCYYNNYNLGQPRHFCKGCRRYWTRGGALRNVPVGGGTRKPSPSAARRKRAVATSSSSSSSTSTTAAVLAPAASPSPLAMSAPAYAAATVLPAFTPSSLDLDRRLLMDHNDRRMMLLDHNDRRMLLDHNDRRVLFDHSDRSFTSLLTPAPDVRFSAGFLVGGLQPSPHASSAPALLMPPPPHQPVSQALPAEGFIWGGMGWPDLSI